ncbi:MAG: CsbD family protein [Vicinamibacteria bacterium]
MNSDIFKGQWKQLEGHARQQWGKLTDDDVTLVKGDKDVLLGKIQERYGRSKEEAMAELDTWLKAKEIR